MNWPKQRENAGARGFQREQMGWHLLSPCCVPSPRHTVLRSHEMRPWMETVQRTKVSFLFLLKTPGTATPDGRSQDRRTWGKLFHPSEPQLPWLVISAPPPYLAQHRYPGKSPFFGGGRVSGYSCSAVLSSFCGSVPVFVWVFFGSHLYILIDSNFGHH